MATIAPNLKGDIDEEYDDSQLDSDEEADRVRKMQGEGKVIINNEAGLLEKFNELKKGFDEGILNRMPPGKKKNVSWLERLDVTSDKKVEIVASEVTDDIQREVSFFNIAIENTKNALNKLKGMNQKLVRPNDYLVEMVKADEVMQKIKSNLVRQQVKIQNFEERKLRRDNKKFAKKVQQVKLLEKQKEKRRNLDAIDKWKQEIKQKGENAADLSSFLKNDPGKKRFSGPTGGRKNLSAGGRGGHGGRGGRGGSNSKGAQQIPRGGKKITKRPGKNTRTNMRNSRGSSRGGRGGSRGGSRGGRGGSRGGRGGRR